MQSVESELVDYLHEHIPLSKAMQVSVDAVSPQRVVLRAPLAPNINHRDTVFGGSASTLSILAAWSLLHTRLTAEGVSCRLVIQHNSMDYLLPIAGEFTATASLAQHADWSRFTRMLARKGRARIAVAAKLEYAGEVVGSFSGDFVALDVEE